MTSRRIGIITALIPEARCLVKNRPVPGVITPVSGRISLLISGIGSEKARLAAERMVDSGFNALISWGTAGALAADIRPGALIIPETIITGEGVVFHTAKNWRTSVVRRLKDCPSDIYLGQVSDSMHVLTQGSEKYRLREHTDSLAVDMESAAIAEVAREKQTPFISIRSISDASTMSIPDSVMKFTGPYGEIRIHKLMTSLMKHPADIPGLISLSRGYRAAVKTLEWIGKRIDAVCSIE